MTDMQNDFRMYLKPTEFIDSDSQEVMAYAESIAGSERTYIDKAVKLYYAVRDGIRYDPYRIDISRKGLKASSTLKRKYGFCVSKAILLAAAARAAGIPSRLHFADVRNHLTSRRLIEVMESEVFFYHAYTELFIENKWVKATPAFTAKICRVSGVEPLEFDGKNDSIFQQFDIKGNRFMDYVNDHGSYADLPFEDLVKAFKDHHPRAVNGNLEDVEGNFEKEIIRTDG